MAKLTNIPFTNIDSEEFVCKWDSEDYTVAAGETVQVLPFLAKHLANHLANKILLREAEKFLQDHAGQDPKSYAGKEPSWMDEKKRNPLLCQMLGWTEEKLKEEQDIDKNGAKPAKAEETVKKSEVEDIVAKAVAAAMKAAFGEPTATDSSGEEEFADIKNKK